jgi:hypothetical protein
MKSNLYYRLNTWVSKKYLSWAETLPSFNGGIISRLQFIQKLNREEADRAYEESRAPENTEIDLLSFTMFEMFNLEDFENIKPGLLKIFSKIQDTSKHRELIPAIDRMVENPLSNGWVVLGLVHPETTRFLAATVKQVIPELPKEVDFIELKLHRISTSIIVLTAEVYLNKMVTKVIKSKHNEKYLSEIRFEKILPTKSYHLNYYSVQSREVM